MRIIYVTSFYYPVVSRIEEIVRRIQEYITPRGHDFYVLTYDRLQVDGKFFSFQKDTINDVEAMRNELIPSRVMYTYAAASNFKVKFNLI